MQMQIAALGRVRNVGDLYDAFTDTFYGSGLTEKELGVLPPSDNLQDRFQMNFVSTENLSQKLKMMEMSAGMKLKVYAGICKVDVGGSGKILNSVENTSYEVRNAITCKMNAKLEQLVIASIQPDARTKLEKLAKEHATVTHVVTEVCYGANVFMSIGQKVGTEGSKKLRSGKLRIDFSALTKVPVGIEQHCEGRKEIGDTKKREKLFFQIDSDLPDLSKPGGAKFENIEEAVNFMGDLEKKMGSLKVKCPAIRYTLKPLSVMGTDRPYREIDLDFIFQEIADRKRDIDDLIAYRDCFGQSVADEAQATEKGIKQEEAKLKSRLAKALRAKHDTSGEGGEPTNPRSSRLDAIEKIAEDYLHLNQFEVPTDLSHALDEIRFMKTLEDDGIDRIGPFDSHPGKKTVYILYANYRWALAAQEAWTANLMRFYYKLDIEDPDEGYYYKYVGKKKKVPTATLR